MPTGLLLFCLEYAEKPGDGAGGIFDSVRSRFSDLAESNLPDIVKDESKACLY